MGELYSVYTRLLLVGIDSIDGMKHICSLHPTKLILPQKSGLCPNDVFRTHSTVDISWANLKLLSCSQIIYEELSSICITYGCWLPYDTKLQDAYWISLKDTNNLALISDITEDLRKI